QRRQGADRQHRECVGDGGSGRDLFGPRTRRRPDRPTRPVVQPGHPGAVRSSSVRRGRSDHLPRGAGVRPGGGHPLLAGIGQGDRLGQGGGQPDHAQFRPRRLQPDPEGRGAAAARGPGVIMGQPTLTKTGRVLVLATAFAGWLCAGLHMATTSLAMKSAAVDLLDRTGDLDRERYESALKRADEKKPFSESAQSFLRHGRTLVARWFAWYQCAFLFGAATGGLVFGRIGDRFGRATGMGLSILTYSVLAAAAALSQAPWQLLLLWYLACSGVGGMWPNGVALVSEAWSELSRPLVAGLIGTSANIGIFGVANVAADVPVTVDSWRWVLWVAASPVVLAVVVLLVVPESPLWLATRGRVVERTDRPHVFRRPLLPVTLVAIALATVPLIGGWGSANWMVPWADNADPFLKAHVIQARAL